MAHGWSVVADEPWAVSSWRQWLWATDRLQWAISSAAELFLRRCERRLTWRYDDSRRELRLFVSHAPPSRWHGNRRGRRGECHRRQLGVDQFVFDACRR